MTERFLRQNLGDKFEFKFKIRAKFELKFKKRDKEANLTSVAAHTD
ncbi:hypothetical protein [Campylobacter showae]|nr:hypothetical protein [Campylobacter showae]